MSKRMGCQVEICFFKPEGYADTHYVETDDRGAAAALVLAKYPNEGRCLNYINVRLCDIPSHAKITGP